MQLPCHGIACLLYRGLEPFFFKFLVAWFTVFFLKVLTLLRFQADALLCYLLSLMRPPLESVLNTPDHRPHEHTRLPGLSVFKSSRRLEAQNF